MNQKGSTLIEVIISFVIIVIIAQVVITSFLSSEKIKRNFVLKDNVINEIHNINNLFSADPKNFLNNLSISYSIVNDNDKYYIYYNQLFEVINTKSNYYIEINYYNLENLYTIELNIFHNNIIDEIYNTLKRSIYV